MSAIATREQNLLDEHAGANAAIDRLERAMCEHPNLPLPLVHRFTPGLYTREIHMPAGARLTSKIHKTEHPFVVTQGRVLVYDDANGTIDITAPYVGITKPGTRRVLEVIEDTVWLTFHPTTETDLDRLEDELILKHSDHLPRRLDARGEVVMQALTGGGQ